MKILKIADRFPLNSTGPEEAGEKVDAIPATCPAFLPREAWLVEENQVRLPDFGLVVEIDPQLIAIYHLKQTKQTFQMILI